MNLSVIRFSMYKCPNFEKQEDEDSEFESLKSFGRMPYENDIQALKDVGVELNGGIQDELEAAKRPSGLALHEEANTDMELMKSLKKFSAVFLKIIKPVCNFAKMLQKAH